MSDIHLLLRRDGSGRPALNQGIPFETAAMPRDPEEVRDRSSRTALGDRTKDPCLLSAQRWGVVVPSTPEGERRLAAIHPLLLRRAEQQGADVTVYKVPLGQTGAEARRWRRDVYRNERVPESERPRYLLLLGDLHEVTIELQQVLSVEAFVGRLAFSHEHGLEAYCEKVRLAEDSPAPSRRLVIASMEDGSEAMDEGRRALVEPCLEAARSHGGRAAPVELLDGLFDGAALLRCANSATGSVLFSMSHGLGPPKGGWSSVQRQRERQGAIALGAKEALGAADIPAEGLLPLGVWFCLACFSAGTPMRSEFHGWLKRLQDAGVLANSAESVLAALPRADERPFTAGLPQAALAHPKGPLAFIGHLDLAWTYAFRDGSGRSRASRFYEALRSLTEGARVGAALDGLLHFGRVADDDLMADYRDEEDAAIEGDVWQPDVERRAQLWMLRSDLRGYVLLGDPAVRLNL